MKADGRASVQVRLPQLPEQVWGQDGLAQAAENGESLEAGDRS